MERGEPNPDLAVNALGHRLSEITLYTLWSRKVVSAVLTSDILTSTAMTWTKFSRSARAALNALEGKVCQKVIETANGETTLSPFEPCYELL